jgi:hypothetical protein
MKLFEQNLMVMADLRHQARMQGMTYTKLMRSYLSCPAAFKPSNLISPPHTHTIYTRRYGVMEVWRRGYIGDTNIPGYGPPHKVQKNSHERFRRPINTLP